MAKAKTQSKPRTDGRSRIPTHAIAHELEVTLAQNWLLAKQTLLPAFRELTVGLAPTLSVAESKRLQAQFLNTADRLLRKHIAADGTREAFPTISEQQLGDAQIQACCEDLRAAFERARLRASLKKEEKIEMLRGMLATRHIDARLKKFFMSGEVKTPTGAGFQGKGFRSMGQEAIYAAAIRLRRVGPGFDSNRTGNGVKRSADYDGDYVAVMIRDIGLALAMGSKPYDLMAAQMGKVGLPTNGMDLHIGDMACGVIPPSAPIALGVGNAVGIGLALKDSGRVVLNCNGEGGTSAGEWHEGINFAAVRNLPVVFIVQNNQTALSTPTEEQFRCQSLTEKAAGYGVRAISIDGTDPEAVFAAVTEAAEACRRGQGPALIELVAMRICGHAHHDDMLYFGQEPGQYLEYPEMHENGYGDRRKYDYWRGKDPIANYRDKLIADGLLTAVDYEEMRRQVSSEIEEAAEQVRQAPWPDGSKGIGPVFTDGERRKHSELLADRQGPFPDLPEWRTQEAPGFSPAPGGKTFWQAIAEALDEELRRDPAVFVMGEDVGGKYGNAFVILKSLLPEFGERLMNTPLAESIIIGAATGAALAGKRPVAEIQFNDFVASGFNQLVNNTAKIFARWKRPVPLTIRLPWGGLRHAGPYHSQNTEPWFYRTPGLKIVCPSTPREAKALLKAAIRDDNPVLFYEHIALYRAANIKQELPGAEEDFVLPIGKAHLKREGADLTIITYGAFVHRCLRAAEQLQQQGISCRVLDLRSLQPLDKAAILWSVKDTNRALIVQEDSKTGGIGQSVASIIAEEAFECLDAPVRVLGALDTPVPYSPTLEDVFLIDQARIEKAAQLLAAY